LAVVLLLLAPLKDTRPASAETKYAHAWQLFLRGHLETSQLEAEQGYRRFQAKDTESALKFQLLEAEAMLWRGANQEALSLLSEPPPATGTPEELVQRLTLEAVAFTHLQQFSAADRTLSQAERICSSSTYSTCGTVPRASGILALEQGRLSEAHRSFLESLSFAREHHDRMLETTVLSYIGVVSLQNEHYDEAVDWSRSAYQAAVGLGAEDMAQVASGNLGWAYFELGDSEKALQLLLEAEKRAKDLGDLHFQLIWLITTGYVDWSIGELPLAAQSYHQALDLATQLNSKEDIVTTLVDIAHVSIDLGKLDEATAYVAQAAPLVQMSGNRLDALDVMLAQGEIAASRRQDQQAESIFRAVEQDPQSQTSVRLAAEHELARLYEVAGNPNAAERMYKTALTTFESARSQVKEETSQLPFLANATGIYDDYIHFLIQHGRPQEALAAADQSRARTLAQNLGVTSAKASFRPATLDPRSIARKSGATLLFYWLGPRQSYLWAVTPSKVALFPLPARAVLAARVRGYSRALLDAEDPMESANADGRELYRLLVAPASRLIRPNTPVMILADGELSQLNFETLLAPGPGPNPGADHSRDLNPDPNPGHSPPLHYWIDDATLLSAPSLAMLAAAKPVRPADRSLLLLGNPVSASDDFPTLPLFGFEMTRIARHFDSRHVAAFSGAQASPAAYLSSNPARYAYIHFVTHAVASSTDPLDSAIILSGSPAGGGSFKLYARDIMQHPIDARLVTISACNGIGTRSYAGEGLVGLSWAFLRAGAHSVIGALWEASDDSSPRLMDSLYAGLESGQNPAAALRQAKLTLLHAQGRFSKPFYWAPFQIYTGR
jgi:CHAT domain-containing protein/Tfp pilus assembly protein PilF